MRRNLHDGGWAIDDDRVGHHPDESFCGGKEWPYFSPLSFIPFSCIICLVIFYSSFFHISVINIVCSVSTYAYLFLRNSSNAVLLLFLLALTRTAFMIRKWWAKAVFCLPSAAILALLAQNPFTHSAFTVTSEVGYVRGPLMLAFYGIAMLYGLFGFAYCIYCRRYLPKNKWTALIIVYVLVHLAVVIQFFHPELLLEMFCTALGEMLIMLSIMRPEERMDITVGIFL